MFYFVVISFVDTFLHRKSCCTNLVAISIKSSGCNPKKWYECPTIGKGIPGQGSFEMNRVKSCFIQM